MEPEISDYSIKSVSQLNVLSTVLQQQIICDQPLCREFYFGECWTSHNCFILIQQSFLPLMSLILAMWTVHMPLHHSP